MAVLMLQSFASQCRATGGTADQEAACLLIAARPYEITDALETEHRVVDVKRHHGHIVVRVRRTRRRPGTECASLIDTFLENLALLVLAVVHELTGVLWLIELTLGRVNTDLAKHALHTKGASFIGNDRNDVLADQLVPRECSQNAHKRHSCGRLAFTGSFELCLERLQRRCGQRR